MDVERSIEFLEQRLTKAFTCIEALQVANGALLKRVKTLELEGLLIRKGDDLTITRNGGDWSTFEAACEKYNPNGFQRSFPEMKQEAPASKLDNWEGCSVGETLTISSTPLPDDAFVAAKFIVPNVDQISGRINRTGSKIDLDMYPDNSMDA